MGRRGEDDGREARDDEPDDGDDPQERAGHHQDQVDLVRSGNPAEQEAARPAQGRHHQVAGEPAEDPEDRDERGHDRCSWACCRRWRPSDHEDRPPERTAPPGIDQQTQQADADREPAEQALGQPVDILEEDDERELIEDQGGTDAEERRSRQSESLVEGEDARDEDRRNPEHNMVDVSPADDDVAARGFGVAQRRADANRDEGCEVGDRGYPGRLGWPAAQVGTVGATNPDCRPGLTTAC